MATNGVKNQLEPFTFLDKSSLEAALKCSICSRYLNVPPIVFCEDVGHVCGRCNSDESTLNNMGPIVRQTAFEELVKNMAFPCMNKYNGCPQVLKFSEVPEHEKSGCRFQPVNCPLFHDQLFSEKKCLWTGNSKKLPDHLRTHNDKVLDPPHFEWPAGLENKIFFTSLDDQVITVVIRLTEKGKYACMVMVNGNDLESQCFRYSLKMTDEEENYSLIMKRNRVEPLSEFMDKVNSLEKTLEIDFEQICKTLQNPAKILASINIVKKTNNEIIQIIGNQHSDILSVGKGKAIAIEQKIVPSDEEILAELECPICREYMISPIYICPTGHSVCSDCHFKVRTCPSCRYHYSNGRNFTLENLTEKVKYPCPNRKSGCSYVSTAKKIVKHRKKCKWQGIYKITKGRETEHWFCPRN